MLTNPRSPRVRAVAKLAKRSARRETGLYLLEGPQAVREALDSAPDVVTEVYATEGALERNRDIVTALTDAGLRADIAEERVVAAMADTVTPQGIIAVARQRPASLDEVLSGGPTLLAICHEIRDPGNLGTIIRVADASGADAVILTGDTVDPYNPKAVRSTTGSLFHIPIVTGAALPEAAAATQQAGLRVLAADVSGEDLMAVRAELAAPTAWLFGNEARGLDSEALALADRALRLPIYGRAESLNLATAASVCLYESAFAQRT